MCGIVGIYRYKNQKPVTEVEIAKMNAVIEHRGPDGSGVFVDNSLGLGHKRLSIIDVSSRSDQPMKSDCGRYVICYNGEVYNYVEMREELKKKGQRFRTESDTEVLLYKLANEGERAVNEFNGMFAYAFWDRQKQRLVITRDRVGIKPLYYYESEDGVIFASEIKSIIELAGKRFDIDKSLIDTYMSMGYVPGQRSLFEGIKKLNPGHHLVVENNQLTVAKYWDLTFEREKDRGEKYYTEKTNSLVHDAIRLQLRSDVPLGVFLSGGVDSSGVVAHMKELGVKDIKTFSVAWDYGDQYNETKYAQEVAKQYGAEHREYFMSPNDLWEFLPEYIRYMDEPVTEAAAISLYYIAKKTKEHVTVVLSGEGADEVFGGYSIYKYMHWVSQYKKIPLPLKRLCDSVLAGLHPKIAKYIELSNKPISKSYYGVSFYDETMKRSLYTQEFASYVENESVENYCQQFYTNSQELDEQASMQYFDLKTWLVDDLLIKADRMSMAASLELRVPFLDHRLMEFSATLPYKYRFYKGESKYLLKKSLENKLSSDILYRKKQGFPTPLSMLFREHLTDEVRTILDSDQHHDRKIFNPDRVRVLISEHANGQADHHKVLWQLIVLEMWQRANID